MSNTTATIESSDVSSSESSDEVDEVAAATQYLEEAKRIAAEKAAKKVAAASAAHAAAEAAAQAAAKAAQDTPAAVVPVPGPIFPDMDGLPSAAVAMILSMQTEIARLTAGEYSSPNDIDCANSSQPQPQPVRPPIHSPRPWPLHTPLPPRETTRERAAR